MITISKISLLTFLEYIEDDEVDVAQLNQFIKNKARDRRKNILKTMNLDRKVLKLNFIK